MNTRFHSSIILHTRRNRRYQENEYKQIKLWRKVNIAFLKTNSKIQLTFIPKSKFISF